MTPSETTIPLRAASPSNRSTTPNSEYFKKYIGENWASHLEVLPLPREQAAFAAIRRRRVSELNPGVRLLVPAGRLKQRANDMTYPFRAHSAFAWLTGWGSDSEPGAVLVFEPIGDTHEVTLYFRERAGRGTDEFYADPEIGEFWIGPRPSLRQVAADLGLQTRDIANLDMLLHQDSGKEATTTHSTVTIPEADPELADVVGGWSPDAVTRNTKFVRDLSELRLVKDPYEVEQLRKAVAATALGFSDVMAELPRIRGHARAERLIDGVFNSRARVEGNTVGYTTIAAAGAHSCILHWTQNDGPALNGDLVLLDAGVEMDSYYTADITRTFPVSGTYTPAQRKVYEAVLEAADAALAVARPGIRFRDIHDAAMAVIARKTVEWGVVTVSVEQAVEEGNQQHRRYMVHGTSHHLGLDVHDCPQARREMYLDGILEPGMVFTIEPGLYFHPDDLTAPDELRGIGVRIEDNILVTAEGAENLSAAIPRTADDVEAWIQQSNN
ncbi:Xaa-Pro aminopeptidase [Arthrobacter sp. MYb23]|uniref:aminopeptidase P family protein n=1 Tax=unclassified Arthrobacter TaxID=235627 RepID=UPI000CFCBA07|nr:MULTISPECIES: aminopeptidase P family protein [unclassified Arthrobacter]PRB43442.1 Xaa-Pro aminopeptidase [Arthrobacter sp. MYb51]PRB96900.1 Xaa-Pro aminopeptidase [Arthrobacter sp. MYb23]